MSGLFVVGAPSGAGKTTLLQRLVEQRPRLRFSVSHTTRAPRDGEQNGRDYHFVSHERFERERDAGGFLEWANVYGKLYGTHREELDRARRDEVDLVLDVDVQGARAVRAQVPAAVLVLVLPPSWVVLEERLRRRGTDSEDEIRRRMSAARDQLAAYPLYDYAVRNDDLERASASLLAILDASRMRTACQQAEIDRLLGEFKGGIGAGSA